MPIIETLGSASSKGFGQFLTSAPKEGTVGIFQLGNSPSFGTPSTIRNKYTYATDASTASGVGAVSQCGRCGRAAAGNSTRGIFALGVDVGGNPSAVRNKYTYATCVSTATGVASASSANQNGSAAGNVTRGIFALGSNAIDRVTTRNKYTYSGCSSTSSGVGAASAASCSGSAAGNSTRGIFALGQTCASVRTTTRNKYTYACCTSTASGIGAASANSNGGSAASWACGVNS